VSAPHYRVITVQDQPETAARIEAITQPAWPEFMHHDPVARENWHVLYEHFPEFQFVLLDANTDFAVAAVNSIAVGWEGDAGDLPNEGWDWAMSKGADDVRQGVQPTVLCGLQVVIPPEHRGKGVSTHAVEAFKRIAKERGFRGMIVPVRPAWKCHYPITPMERYVRWLNEAGFPFDPWLRTHVRVGGRIAEVCPRSMTIAGSVGEWESWTGLRFPESGNYVVPGALVPVEIDRERDEGTYVEPNVWVWHAPSA